MEQEKIITVGQLRESLKAFKDDDLVVAEIDEMVLGEDLYDFCINPWKLDDGRQEVRLSLIEH